MTGGLTHLLIPVCGEVQQTEEDLFKPYFGTQLCLLDLTGDSINAIHNLRSKFSLSFFFLYTFTDEDDNKKHNVNTVPYTSSSPL